MIRTLRPLALLAFLVLCTACGIKGPPLPPLIRMAERTRDLSIAQEGTTATLTWSYPQMTTAGTPLPDLEEIEVWRVEIPKGQEPSLADRAKDRSIRDNFMRGRGEIIQKLSGDGLNRATVGSKLEIKDELSSWLKKSDQPSPVLWYAVVNVCCSGRRSDFSNMARIEPSPSPERPKGFTANAQIDGVLLSWDKPELGKIRIERSSDASSWDTLEVNPTPENTWLDTEAGQGKTWFYRARLTIQETSGALHLGKTTEPLRVEYADIYPPEPPTELLCLPEGGQIRLRWLGSDEAASYRIEREDADGKTRVLAEKLTELSLVDRNAPRGKLIYHVWAVDKSGNRSKPAECQSVSEGSR